jgi:hypothetical protein
MARATRRAEPSPEAEVGYRAHLALSSLSDGVPLTVWWGRGEVQGGKLVSVSNDYKPRRPIEDGGSNLILHYEDGRSIPLEQVTRVERPQ